MRAAFSAYWRRSAVVCGLWCSFIHPAFAGDDVATQLPEISVDAPLLESAPTSFHEIVQPAHETHATTSLPEILARATGVHVKQLGSQGQFASISIRGSSAEQVAVYVDGARLNLGGTGVVDLSTIPLHSIESIEIIRGGGAAQFGDNAVGGVVNITTKSADHDGQSLEANLSGGSFFTAAANASYARSSSGHRVLASVGHFSSRGNYAFTPAATTLAGTVVPGSSGGFTRDHNRSLNESLLTKYDGPIGERSHVTVANDFFFADRDIPGLEMETTQLAPTNPLEAGERGVRDTTHVDWHVRDLAGKSGWELTAGLHNIFEWWHFQDASPALGPAIDRATTSDAVNPYLLITNDSRNRSGHHQLTVRSDYTRDMFADRARNSTTVGSGARARDTFALLAQDEWRVWQDRVAFTPAVRLAHATHFGFDPNARLGVSARVWKSLTLKSNIETARRIPTFLELYYPDEGFIRGNPNLDRERAWHWDVGAGWNDAHYRAEAAYFQQTISNSILFVPISATTIAPINTFRVLTHGVEFAASAAPWEWLRVSGNYTWLAAHFASTGRQLAGRPRQQANARVELSHALPLHLRGQIFAETQWVSAVPVNVDNTVWLSARSTVDCGSKVVWRTHTGAEYSATLSATNITNVQIYDARGFPLPRRALYFSLSGRWG